VEADVTEGLCMRLNNLLSTNLRSYRGKFLIFLKYVRQECRLRA